MRARQSVIARSQNDEAISMPIVVSPQSVYTRRAGRARHGNSQHGGHGPPYEISQDVLYGLC